MCPYCECNKIIINDANIVSYDCGYVINKNLNKELNTCSKALLIINYLKTQVNLLTAQLNILRNRPHSKCQDFNPN